MILLPPPVQILGPLLGLSPVSMLYNALLTPLDRKTIKKIAEGTPIAAERKQRGLLPMCRTVAADITAICVRLF